MGTTPLFRSLEHVPLQGVMAKLKLIWNEISYPKGYVLINRDKIERDVYLIKQGIARAYLILKWTVKMSAFGLGWKMTL